MAHRSFSAVQSLRRCGEAYRLQRIEHVSEQPSSARIAGKVIHEVTELIDLEWEAGETEEGTLQLEAEKLAGELLPKAVEEELTPEYPTTATFQSFGRGTGQDVEWYRTTGIPRSIANYIHWRTINPQLSIYTLPTGELAMELPFELNLFGGDPIIGTIDRIFINTETAQLKITDLKSGLKPKSTEQLGVYRQACLAAGLDVNVGSYVYGLKSELKETVDIDLSYWTAERLSRIYGEAGRQIAAGIYLPNPGEACFMCSVRKHCEYYATSFV